MGTIKIKDSNGNWVKLPNYGVQEFPEAPTDGKTYGRKNSEWTEVSVRIPITVSSSAPTAADGLNGDVWVQYALPRYTLTITGRQPGLYTVTPSDYSSIEAGATVTISGSQLIRFTGDITDEISPSKNSFSFIMDSNKTINAEYIPTP